MICIFPGTFNPIHNAHLRMAEFALNEFGFEKIIFIPSYKPPHKEIDTTIAKHRFEMVELATKENPKFEVSDIEYQLEGKSYSLITVKKIIEQYSINGRLNFIIGTDAFVKIESWYKADELKNLVHFIVFPRRGDGDEETYKKLKKTNWDFEIVDCEYNDISSTQIRMGEISGTNITVEEYIKNNDLYKI